MQMQMVRAMCRRRSDRIFTLIIIILIFNRPARTSRHSKICSNANAVQMTTKRAKATSCTPTPASCVGHLRSAVTQPPRQAMLHHCSLPTVTLPSAMDTCIVMTRCTVRRRPSMLMWMLMPKKGTKTRTNLLQFLLITVLPRRSLPLRNQAALDRRPPPLRTIITAPRRILHRPLRHRHRNLRWPTHHHHHHNLNHL